MGTPPDRTGIDDDDGTVPISPTAPPRMCAASGEPNPFSNVPGIRTCQANSDCDGYENFDGATCCLFPQCICGSRNPGASDVMCVEDEDVPSRGGDDDDENGDDDDDDDNIVIIPTVTLPPVVAPPLPEPEPEPILTCPSNVSDNYQFLNGVRACNTNSDCGGYETLDGPTCCLYPLCVCGNPTPGASDNIKCLA